jgi:hypothetical protein
LRCRLATVAANAHAKECLRLAAAAAQDQVEARRCRAQAVLMMRQMQSGTRLLERRLAAREKALELRVMQRAGFWFKDVSVPAPVAAPEPVLMSCSTPTVPRASGRRAGCRPIRTSARQSPTSSPTSCTGRAPVRHALRGASRQACIPPADAAVHHRT